MLFDMHCHTEFSHDSNEKTENICERAVSLGLDGVAITDHCDVQFKNEYNIKAQILASVENAKKASLIYGEQITVMSGIEIGESTWDLPTARDITASADYDVILGSVHQIKAFSYPPYAIIDFGAFSESQLEGFTESYFNELEDTIEKFEIDVLCHLTNPIAYIEGKYKRPFDICKYTEKIDAILKEIIIKGVALEINTAAMKKYPDYNKSTPDINIIKRYKELGGSRLTLGSDAHISQNIAYGFNDIITELKKLGIAELCYFKERKPFAYKIGE